MFRITAVTTLVTGTMFLMWLGEQITERGVGNGISMIIFAGIAAGLPNAIGGLFELVRTGAMHPVTALFICVLVVLVLRRWCSSSVASEDSGELCQAPGRQQGLWWAGVASAVEAEYVRA